MVACLLRGGHSRVEQTLLEAGRGGSAIHQRMEFQDLTCEIFILAPTDLGEDAEIRLPAG